MRWLFSNMAAGIVRWATVALISAVCLMYGFAPDIWIRMVLSDPPTILYSPWPKLFAVIFGVLIFGGMIWLEIRRYRAPHKVGAYISPYADKQTSSTIPAITPVAKKHYSRNDKEWLSELYSELGQILVTHGATHRGNGVIAKSIEINQAWHPLINRMDKTRMDFSGILVMCADASQATSTMNQELDGPNGITNKTEYLRFAEEIEAVLDDKSRSKLRDFQEALNGFWRVVTMLDRVAKSGDVRLLEETQEIGTARIMQFWTGMTTFQNWLADAFQRSTSAKAKLAE